MAIKITKIQSPPPKKTEKFAGITLSLISHTNIGKTTLARTLLRKDVGEVFDQAHVTDKSKSYKIIEKNGNILRLWDTPGFGNSSRLLKRLKQENEPLNWLVTEIWDKFSDRAFYSSQQAVKNVKEEADIVLYLINASEKPEQATYIDIEMQIIQWLKKPVIFILNQTGKPKSKKQRQKEIQLWKEFSKKYKVVKNVLNLDAFTRCWIQEHFLLNEIEKIFQNNKKKLNIFKSLSQSWKEKNFANYQKSIKIFSIGLANSVSDGVKVSKETLIQKIGIGRDELNSEIKEARQKLANNLSKRTKKTIDQIIKINGIEGGSEKRIKPTSAEQFGMPEQVDESLWAAIGGIAAGTTAGLSADLLAGGLTFGGGAILGGLGGGAASYFLAKSMNLARGADNRLRWSKAHFREQFQLSLLSYLAIAHYGRGRGSWQESKEPEIWKKILDEIITQENYWKEIDNFWQKGEKIPLDQSQNIKEISNKIATTFKELIDKIFEKLYPKE